MRDARDIHSCPCGKGRLAITDSRKHPWYVRRRRRCDSCGAAKTTIEVALPEAGGVLVESNMARDGRTRPRVYLANVTREMRIEIHNKPGAFEGGEG